MLVDAGAIVKFSIIAGYAALLRADDPSLSQDAAAKRTGSTRHGVWKYAGFIKRQEAQVQKVIGKLAKPIPESVDYAAITTLRMEAREKLAKMQPTTVGQASRIGGVTPADVSSLLVHLEVGARKVTRADARAAAKAQRKELAGREMQAREGLDAEAAETPSR